MVSHGMPAHDDILNPVRVHQRDKLSQIFLNLHRTSLGTCRSVQKEFRGVLPDSKTHSIRDRQHPLGLGADRMTPIFGVSVEGWPGAMVRARIK